MDEDFGQPSVWTQCVGGSIAKAARERRSPNCWSVDLMARITEQTRFSEASWLVIGQGLDPIGWREVDGPEIRRRAVEGEGDNEASRVVAGSLVAGVGGVEA